MLGLILLATIPTGDAVEYRCDTTEVNVVVCNNGCPRFEQVIWRDLSEIRDWRMTTKCGQPTYDHATGCYVTRWIENGVLVEVKSETVLYSVSEEDRELDERVWLPEDQRKRINR